jgi:hypothetical protein
MWKSGRAWKRGHGGALVAREFLTAIGGINREAEDFFAAKRLGTGMYVLENKGGQKKVKKISRLLLTKNGNVLYSVS